MLIRDVLLADWTVAEIEVTVREKDSTRYIMEYRIGRDVKAGRSQRFVQETELGNLYSNGGNMKTLFINRIIQHRQLEKKAQGKEMCVGVLLENIPVELLNLTVDSMRPYGCGNSDGMHGYRFTCYVETWSGIKGEYEQIYGCQGFPDDYIIDRDYTGKPYRRTEQVKRCGNAVCPPLPAALVRTNLPELCIAKRTGNMRIKEEQTGQLRFT